MKILTALFIALLAGPLDAMEFYWGSAPPTPVFSEMKGDRRNSILYMKGDIRAGDYVKLKSFLRMNMDRFLTSPRFVLLASNGGDLVEALRIADVMKSAMVKVFVVDRKCASACFFLFLTGKFRYSPPDLLGVHRPYFEQKYFSGLSPSQAEKRHNELAAGVKRILDESGVPRQITEQMYATASTEMYWLNIEDMIKLGSRPAWYEELLIAKCGFQKNLEDAVDHNPTNATMSAYRNHLQMVVDCEVNLVEQENASLFLKIKQ